MDCGVSDVRAIPEIQTYDTRFIDDLILNELLDLSRKRAVVRDDVASIRVYSCNMILLWTLLALIAVLWTSAFLP